MYDKIDKKIIKALRDNEMNMSMLMLKTFPRESVAVFRRRLERLKNKKIITISGGKMKKFTGNSYRINLVKK